MRAGCAADGVAVEVFLVRHGFLDDQFSHFVLLGYRSARAGAKAALRTSLPSTSLTMTLCPFGRVRVPSPSSRFSENSPSRRDPAGQLRAISVPVSTARGRVA